MKATTKATTYTTTKIIYLITSVKTTCSGADGSATRKGDSGGSCGSCGSEVTG